jgi:hypothetical protein
MSQEDSSPLRLGSRSLPGSSKGAAGLGADRRPPQFWKAFNNWWLRNVQQSGKRPVMDDINRQDSSSQLVTTSACNIVSVCRTCYRALQQASMLNVAS